MNDNEMMTPDTAEAELDSAWGDEDGGFEAADAAGTAADQPEAGQEDTQAAQGGGEQGAQTDEQQTPELFTVHWQGRPEQLTREQVLAMAQKGRDYDTVRAERDRLKGWQQDNERAVSMVREYAQRMGMDVPRYLDFCRKQELIRGGMDERAADQTLQMEKREADVNAREAVLNAEAQRKNSLLEQTRAQQAERQRGMERFLQAYPDVKAEAIPKEVWAQVARGTPLLSAYTMHENQRLRAELAAERQNQANRQRTPGTLGGNAGAELDEIDRLWAEDD